MVGGNDGDERHAAFLVRLAMDRERLAEFARDRILHDVARGDVGRFGNPVGCRQQFAQLVHQLGLVAQFLAHCRLSRGHAFLAPAGGVAQSKPLVSQVVQLAQQLALPAVPRARPDRANIDRGEDGELAQPFESLHFGDEILDRLGVGKVALEGGVAHQQVLAHHPRGKLGFLFVEAEARAQPLGHFGA